MKMNYGMTFALLATLTVTSCNTSKKISIVQPETEMTSTHVKQEMRSLTNDEWDGTWIIETAERKAVVGIEPVEIIIDTKSGKIYGNDGCNVINGEIVFDSDNQVRFESLLSTMMACDPKVTDRVVQNALNTTRSYQVTDDSEGIAIKFCDEQGKTVMTLAKRMADQLNGAWEVTTINGIKIADEELPSLVIDIQEERISGFAGCNRMFGTVILDNTAYGISFDQIGTTRMACPNMETEQNFVEALNLVKGFYLIDETHAALYQKPGKAIIVLEKK